MSHVSATFVKCVMCFLLSQRDPERGWDRSKVKGLLANLITIRDVSYATGLEVVAGGRLYNIVVDTEVGVLEGSVHVFFVQIMLVFQFLFYLQTSRTV